MTKIDIAYRRILLPHVTELRRGDGIDLNLAEELLAPHGLYNLNRAERIVAHLRPGVR